MNSFMNSYRNLTPGQKKWLSIGGAGGVVLLIVFALSSVSDGGGQQLGGKKTIGQVLTDIDPRKVGLDALNSTQSEQGRNIVELKRNLKSLMENTANTSELKGEIQELKKAVSDYQALMESSAQDAQVQRDQFNLLKQEMAKLEKASPSKDQVVAEEEQEAKEVKDKERKKYESVVTSPNQNKTAFFQSAPRPVEDVARPGAANRTEEVKKIITIGEVKKEEAVDPDKDFDVYLPAGSMISGALITGVDAPTGNGARRDPFPVLLRVKKEAVLPNRFRADIRECFLISSAFGDLSSERAYMRAETISCIRDDGRVVESGLDAFATGEDGKAGVRGRLISKQGAILARSLMAGFMQGVSEAFNVRSVPSINVTGANSNDETIAPVYEQALNSEQMQGAAVGGAGRALERIADFYLEMAENLYPVIEIDAAREIDFIVKKGVQLKLMTKGGK